MRARIEEHGQITGSEDEQAFEVMCIAAEYQRSAMGIETFSPRKFSRDLTMYSPMRIRSKIEFGLWYEEVDRIVFKQSSSDAMTHLTNDRQRRHDLWIVGQEHARDAVKHCVTFFATAHDKPRLRPRAWPHIDWKELGDGKQS